MSLLTEPKPESDLVGLVYGVTLIPDEDEVTFYHRPMFWAIVVAVIFVVINIVLW